MRKLLIGLALMSGIFLSMPAWSWSFSCGGRSGETKPVWVSKLDYSEKGFYIGVGSAEKDSRRKDERRKASESDAKAHLVQRIQVTIKAENKLRTS